MPGENLTSVDPSDPVLPFRLRTRGETRGRGPHKRYGASTGITPVIIPSPQGAQNTVESGVLPKSQIQSSGMTTHDHLFFPFEYDVDQRKEKTTPGGEQWRLINAATMPSLILPLASHRATKRNPQHVFHDAKKTVGSKGEAVCLWDRPDLGRICLRLVSAVSGHQNFLTVRDSYRL